MSYLSYPKMAKFKDPDLELQGELLHRPELVKTRDEFLWLVRRRLALLDNSLIDIASLSSGDYQNPTRAQSEHIAKVADNAAKGLGIRASHDVDSLLRDVNYALEFAKTLPAVTGVEVENRSLRFCAWLQFDGGELPGVWCERQDWAVVTGCVALTRTILSQQGVKVSRDSQLEKRQQRLDQLGGDAFLGNDF